MSCYNDPDFRRNQATYETPVPGVWGMFDRLKKLFRAESVDDYVRRVAHVLEREGLEPADLDEIQSVPAFEETGRIFGMLRERALSPEEAAQALRLATSLFHKTKHMAEVRGWPLKSPDVMVRDLPRKEAYFLELLTEAASSVQFRDAQR
jgi:hypothetical protein